MAFVPLPDGRGKLYVPDHSPENSKKHGCVDCYYCQFCDDDRCEKCLKRLKGLCADKRKNTGGCGER